jgi:TPR repeat protein
MNGHSMRAASTNLLGTMLLLWLSDAGAMLTDGRPGAFHEPARLLQPVRPAETAEAVRWQEIQTARRPSRIAALCRAFLRDFPASAKAEDARSLAAGAARAQNLQYQVGLSGDYFEAIRGNATLAANLMGAARGSPGAAYEIAQAYGNGSHGTSASLYRHEQWMRFAAELGHARASWDLAQIYNAYGRVADAAHFEKRATEKGYKPPPRLSNRDY